jgi:hypothetical protein
MAIGATEQTVRWDMSPTFFGQAAGNESRAEKFLSACLFRGSDCTVTCNNPIVETVTVLPSGTPDLSVERFNLLFRWLPLGCGDLPQFGLLMADWQSLNVSHLTRDEVTACANEMMPPIGGVLGFTTESVDCFGVLEFTGQLEGGISSARCVLVSSNLETQRLPHFLWTYYETTIGRTRYSGSTQIGETLSLERC